MHTLLNERPKSQTLTTPPFQNDELDDDMRLGLSKLPNDKTTYCFVANRSNSNIYLPNMAAHVSHATPHNMPFPSSSSVRTNVGYQVVEFSWCSNKILKHGTLLDIKRVI